MEVKDNQNATGSDSVTVTVYATESPEALILSPTADGVYSDQLMTFSGILSDGEDDSEVLISLNLIVMGSLEKWGWQGSTYFSRRVTLPL